MIETALTTINNNSGVDIGSNRAYYGIGDDVIIYQTMDGFEVQIGKTSDIVIGYVGTATEIVFPEKFVNETYTIAEGVFNGNKDIVSVTFGKGLTEIGKDAFNGCTNLTTVTFATDGQLTKIGEQAFQHCTSLTGVTMPNSVTSIGTRVFDDCTSLGTLVLSENLKAISGEAFDGCTSLTKVIVPDNVESIGIWAFRGCTSLL